MEEDEGKALQANMQELTGLVRELMLRQETFMLRQETLENTVQAQWREIEKNGGKVRAKSNVMKGVEHLTREEALTGSVNLDVYPGTRQGLSLLSPGTPPSVQFGRTPLRVIGADIRVTDPGDELARGRLGENPLYSLSESTASHREGEPFLHHREGENRTSRLMLNFFAMAKNYILLLFHEF